MGVTSPLRPAVLGEDYQARTFWIEACRLFFDRRFVRVVSIEHRLIRAFDDVVTGYSEPVLDAHGREVVADHVQAKFHVAYDQSIRGSDLTKPKFIGATKFSLMDRLLDATKRGSMPRRLTLLTPWRIDPSDALRKIVSTEDGAILTDRLLAGATSEVRDLRESLRVALGNPGDDRLVSILEHLRIADGQNMAALNDKLDRNLERAGLRPAPPTVAVHPYDALAHSFVKGPTRVRDHEAVGLEAVLRREGLWVGRPVAPVDGSTDLGIKSFERWSYNLEDDARVLNLIPFFHGRDTAEAVGWNADILPAIDTFMLANVRSGQAYRLHLDAHLSIAFAAGYAVDRADATIVPVQRTAAGGRIPWPAEDGIAPSPLWSDIAITEVGSGPELAVAIEVSQWTFDDVAAYVKRELPRVGRIARLTIASGPSRTAVLGGAHAHALAEHAGTIVRGLRTDDRGELAHIFAAAPADLFFLMGRQAAPWGRLRLYEFEGPSGPLGAYHPAFELPSS